MSKGRAEPLVWSAQRAFSRLLTRLTRSDLSPLDARRYLQRQGCPEEFTEQSVRRAEEMGYISVERCQDSLLRKAVSKKWSQRKLKQQGSLHGLTPADTLDEVPAIQKLVERWQSQGLEREKILARLQRRGFGHGSIREALKG